MIVMCNCQGNRELGPQGCFCNDLAFSAFWRVSSKLVVGICALVVGPSCYRQWFHWCCCFPVALWCALWLLTPTPSPYRSRGKGHRALERSTVCVSLHTVHCAYRALCALYQCAMCALYRVCARYIFRAALYVSIQGTQAPTIHPISAPPRHQLTPT